MAALLRNLDQPTRLVGLGWGAGATLLAAAIMLDVIVAHKYLLEWLVLIWLMPLAVYDVQRKEVPHMACVGVPCLAAMVYAVVGGAWQVSLVAALVIAASERRNIRDLRAKSFVTGMFVTLACLLALASGEAAPGAISVVGFWLAFELDWWAGADALVAIALAILWPGIELLVVLACVHGLAACIGHLLPATLRELSTLGVQGQRQANIKLGTRKSPGIPVLTAVVVCLTAWSSWIH